jgi:N-methylhydantoinase B/oxoprolinase/acetone carboxylase alpha subunit
MALDEVLLEVEEKMESAVEHLNREFRGIRTGRASVGLVDHIKVEAGDLLLSDTWGGGGCGDPFEREIDKVQFDANRRAQQGGLDALFAQRESDRATRQQAERDFQREKANFDALEAL